jgi:hypothetical protein
MFHWFSDSRGQGVSALLLEQTDPALQRRGLTFARDIRDSFPVAVGEFWTDFSGAARIARSKAAAGVVSAGHGFCTDSRSTASFWSMKNWK